MAPTLYTCHLQEEGRKKDNHKLETVLYQIANGYSYHGTFSTVRKCAYSKNGKPTRDSIKLFKYISSYFIEVLRFVLNKPISTPPRPFQEYAMTHGSLLWVFGDGVRFSGQRHVRFRRHLCTASDSTSTSRHNGVCSRRTPGTS